MPIADLLNQPVTVITRAPSGDDDDYGNDIAAEHATKVLGLAQQQNRSEREGLVPEGDWLLVLPAGTDISADDTVIFDGYRHRVYGAPWLAVNARTGKVDHIEATLTRTAGGQEEGS